MKKMLLTAGAVFLVGGITLADIPATRSGDPVGAVYATSGMEKTKQTGETVLQGRVAPIDIKTQRAIEALKSAKARGDESAAKAIHEDLGWVAPAPAGGVVPSSLSLPTPRRVVRAERSGGNAKWGGDILVTLPSWSSGYASMAVRSDGTLYLVAEDLNQNYLDVYDSHDGGVTWNYIFSLYGAENPTKPSIAVGEGYVNRLLIAYELGKATTSSSIVVFWQDLDGGGNGSVVVDTSPLGGLAHPRICVDSPEYSFWYPYLTYVQPTITKRQDSSNLIFCRSVDQGDSWQAPVLLEGDVTMDDRPDIDFGGSNLYIVYTRTSGDSDVHLRRSTDLGSNWDPPVALASLSYNEYEPRVAATHGASATIVAFAREYAGGDHDIDGTYSLDGGRYLGRDISSIHVCSGETCRAAGLPFPREDSRRLLARL